MAITVIGHETLTASQASFVFSSIPTDGTYQDLMLVLSHRSTTTGVANVRIRFNDTTSGYASRALTSNSSSTASEGGDTAYLDVGYNTPSDYATGLFGQTRIYIKDYASSRNKSLNTEFTTDSSASNAYFGYSGGLWSNTSAINKIEVFSENGDFAAYSSATLYGVKSAASKAKATGGTIGFADGYVYHIFTSSGTFTPTEDLTGVEYLVIGGGGGGRNDYNNGGGGGAGGYRSSVSGESSGGGSSAESTLSLTSGTAYTVTIGAGGARADYNDPYSSGNDTTFATITSLGGGAGTVTGGSGGGGGGTPGSGTANQGYAGGAGVTENAGGGGGAGGVGGTGVSGNAGDGGIGLASAITGATVYRAGGGGGGSYSNPTTGLGSIGGGGQGGGGRYSASAGTVNTGSGGGGAEKDYDNQYGNFLYSGAGGSGIVIVRYAA